MSRQGAAKEGGNVTTEALCDGPGSADDQHIPEGGGNACPAMPKGPEAEPAAVRPDDEPATDRRAQGSGFVPVPSDRPGPQIADPVPEPAEAEVPSPDRPDPGAAGTRRLDGVSAGAHPPSPGPKSIRGRLDAVNRGRIVGWAIDHREPSKRLQIEIWEGERLVAVGEAAKERPDLKRLNIGDGQSSFSIPLPRGMADGEPHTIRARVAGTRVVLEGLVSFTFPAETVQGVIETISGTTLSGWVTGSGEGGLTVELVVDGAGVATLDVPPLERGERHPVMVQLPPSLLDGTVRWFELKARDSGAVVASTVAATDYVATPEHVLQAHAKSFPGILSPNARNRYAALERQFTAAPAAVARQADGPNALSLADYLRQLDVVHRQVQRGTVDQKRRPTPLTVLGCGTPRVSVVIPAHNKFWATYNCIAALILAPNRTGFEIIVVDDGSTDMTTELPAIVKGITVLRHDTSQGFVTSSNRGAHAARGDFVVMLNNDTEPCAGWIDELIFVFDTFADVGLAGGKLIHPDGRLQEAGGIVFPTLNASNYGRGGNPLEPRYNYTRQVDYVSGACIMLRKALWDRLGGVDELYAPASCEDADLAFRVRAEGLRTYYTPFAEIVHLEGASNGTSGVKRDQAVNDFKFRKRWAGVLRTYPATEDPELAKDRGVRHRAMIIDHQVPRPDKDAASYAALQEMRLLQALGFKLTFVPSNLAHLGRYTEDLQRLGVECLYAPFQASVRAVIRERGPDIDVVYIRRNQVAARYIDAIRAAAPHAKIVFNNADLHVLREIRAAMAGRRPETPPAAMRARQAELDVMRRTDLTLSYTDTEAAVIASHNLGSTMVARCPWVIEVDDRAPPFGARSDLAFLGDCQHPPNEEAMRFFVAEIMPALRTRMPGLVLRIFGPNVSDGVRALGTDDVVIEGHVEDVADVYHRCRLFIAPLRSGAGIKGEVIGALASGTPTVLTSLAAEGIGISRGLDALVADSPAQWVTAITALYGDEPRWTAMSVRARQFTRDNFSFDNGLEMMRSALAMAGVDVGSSDGGPQPLGGMMAGQATPPGEPRRAVVVLGMHRSGTSALTQALSLCGFTLPGDPMPAGPDNPQGFFEPLGVVRLNAEVMDDFGATWDRPEPLLGTGFDVIEHRLPLTRTMLERYTAAAAEVLEQSFGAGDRIMLKDPRLCMTLPLWLRALEVVGYAPTFIHIHRHPMDVAHSLRRRNGLSLQHGMQLWQYHVSEVLGLERAGLRPVSVAYDDLLSRPRDALGRILTALGLDAADVTGQAVASIQAEERHYRAAPNALATDPSVPLLVRATWRFLSNKAQPSDEQRLETIVRLQQRLKDAADFLVRPDSRGGDDAASRPRHETRGSQL